MAGTLADHRRLRKEQGLYKEDPGEIKEADPDDSQIAKLKKHVEQVEKELAEKNSTLEKMKENLYESLGIKS